MVGDVHGIDLILFTCITEMVGVVNDWFDFVYMHSWDGWRYAWQWLDCAYRQWWTEMVGSAQWLQTVYHLIRMTGTGESDFFLIGLSSIQTEKWDLYNRPTHGEKEQEGMGILNIKTENGTNVSKEKSIHGATELLYQVSSSLCLVE